MPDIEVTVINDEFEHALFMLGILHGMLKHDDVRSGIVQAIRQGQIRPEYLTKLRDQLNTMIEACKQ